MLREELFEKFNNYIFSKEENVLLITHNDLDGSGPVVVLRNVFKNLKVIHSTNANMSKIISKENLKLYSGETNYNHIFVCDISPSLQTAEEIKNLGMSDKFIILDHHPTADFLNDFSFALVAHENPEDSFSHNFYENYNTLGNPSGSSLMLDFIYHKKLLENNDFLNELIFNIECFDTWDWHNLCNDYYTPFKLNMLFRIIGASAFDTSYDEKTSLFDEFDERIINIYEDKSKRYCRKKLEDINFVDLKGYNCILVQSPEHVTELFELLHERYPDIDIYIIDTGNSYSFRTRKPGIDVGKICKEFGGGGHEQAGGIAYDYQKKCVEKFNEFFSIE